ncbi:MAG: sulfotransferase [Bacteroidetes bacterium]|nr:sulfotransferase [Bacteroidota bacterium]
MPSQKTAIVLGMLRSGTSMTAGLLERLGVQMGNEMLPASQGNPLGYFEDMDFFDLNRRILRQAGGDMHHPPAREAIAAQSASFEKEIVSVLGGRVEDCWGWKDPVTSLTLDLYLPHVVNPHLIVCRRDVEAVVTSYDKKKTENIDARTMWREYNSRIDAVLSDNPTVPTLELSYEQMVINAEETVDELIRFLGLSPSSEERNAAIESVASKDEIRRLRRRQLINAGLRRPWAVPAYLLRRLRLMMQKS